MPDRSNQKITDFVPGQRVRVVKSVFRTDPPFVVGEIVTVEAVHPLNEYGSGTLTIKGKTSTEENPDWHPGSFGHLLFEPLDEFEVVDDDGLDADNLSGMDLGDGTDAVEETRYPIGTRVVVTDKRTRVGNFSQGSGGSPYVGATGTVAEHYADGSYRIDFDDDELSSYGSWTNDALDRTAEKFSVGDRVTLREFNVPFGNDAKECWPQLVGAPATVTNADPDDDAIDVRWDDPKAGDSGNRWHAGWFQRADVEPGGITTPAYAEARIELAKARVEIDNLTDALRIQREERSTLTQAASDERRRLVEEIDNEKARVETLRSNLEQTIREANEFEAALMYAKSLLEPEEAARVDGFALGFTYGADKA